MRIALLSASVMGTAHDVAASLESQLTNDGYMVIRTTTIDEWLSDEPTLLLVVCSNTGAGELPEPANTLFVQLTTQYPRIAEKPYAIINLGDSSYQTFGEAGHKLNNALLDLGATPATDMLVVDACTGEDPNELALNWWTQSSL